MANSENYIIRFCIDGSNCLQMGICVSLSTYTQSHELVLEVEGYRMRVA